MTRQPAKPHQAAGHEHLVDVDPAHARGKQHLDLGDVRGRPAKAQRLQDNRTLADRSVHRHRQLRGR